MKKIISYVLLTTILILQLGGCGTADSQEGPADAGGLLDASAVSKLDGRDNSLDAYSSVVNIPLQTEDPPNAITGGGERCFLGASRAYQFKKHLFENADECWDELSFVSAQEAGSERFDRENQVWDVGPVAGTDHYVSFDYEALPGGTDYRYFLTERNEAHEVLREFPLEFLTGGELSGTEVIMSFSDFAGDQSGAVHLVRQTGEGPRYLLVSPAGELLAEYTPDSNHSMTLIPLYDGRVAFSSAETGRHEDTALLYMDPETGRPVELASLESFAYCLNLLDEDTLLYADQEGVYRSGLSGRKPELLYRWANHGILTSHVPAIQADGEGRISLLYEGSGTYNYLSLEPTTEEVELCEITLAVSDASSYQRLVAEFTKRYPTCHIELKDDYDRTALLTELTAGKGPVLVDTILTGFEEQEKLWEPLDAVMEELGIAEELQPAALEMGRIDGTLYGIVTDFHLRTLVTGDPDLADWDYDSFLQCITDRPELEAIFDQYDGDFGAYFLVGFLSHGMDDCYFLDGEEGNMRFDSDRFRKALELAEKYCVREEGVSPGSSLLEGKVLCNALYVSKPEQLALYRLCYGEDANYIGYPTKDGAAHFLENGSLLAVRSTATKQEKEAAAAFLGLCLSYEGQILAAKDINFALSVRRDVLEEQIAGMDENTSAFAAGFDQITLGKDLNVALDRETLLDMLEKARPARYFPLDFRNILFEELDQYFSGGITEDKLIDNLESCLGLYLGERN